MSAKVRKALHAGSWYTSHSTQLHQQLQKHLEDAKVNVGVPNGGVVKALIGPHAGYSYCAKTAAHAYKTIQPSKITHVFVLGPCHHVYIEGCALSAAKHCETPIRSLEVCTDTINELKNKHGKYFASLDVSDEEDEHSLEMHLPWIAKTFGNHTKIVPIMVGQLPDTMASTYGAIFAKYLAKPSTFFVISSDFCHWGKRFGYTYFDSSWGPIHKSIEKLDKLGMQAIESMNPSTFAEYMKKYRNTICGRNPIMILLHMITSTNHQGKSSIQFLHYSQSSEAKSHSDSSVSYAAGILISDQP